MSEPRIQKLSFFEKAGYSLGRRRRQLRLHDDDSVPDEFLHGRFGPRGQRRRIAAAGGRACGTPFFDPMMGLMADRTNTRWGKFRPWVLWTAVPWAS
jgi:glycoside/pentoside/hexuronide:cation symporter, GPH family